jgi:hypothetical protein
MRQVLLAFGFAWALSACGSGLDADRMVIDYCMYGARSEAQLEGCIDHVTADEVKRRDSNAARWARNGGECLGDAGPFCRKALEAERAGYCETPEEHATDFCIRYRRTHD